MRPPLGSGCPGRSWPRIGFGRQFGNTGSVWGLSHSTLHDLALLADADDNRVRRSVPVKENALVSIQDGVRLRLLLFG